MQLDDAAYMSEKNPQSKKFRRFHNEMTKCLDHLEKVPASDFASLNNGLMTVQKILDNNKGCDEVPCKLQLCRVFGKTLDPNSDFMGVHRTGIATMGKIFRYLGAPRVARDLPLYCMSVFALLPHAAIQTRPEVFTLLETYIKPLPAAPLLQCFSGLAAAVLPTLNPSDGPDQYNRVLKLLDEIHARLKSAETDAQSGPVPVLKHPPGHPITTPVGGDRAFYCVLWSIVHNNAKIRVHALRYLRTKLATAELVPEAQSDDDDDDGGGEEERKQAVPVPNTSFGREKTEMLTDFIGRPSQVDETQLGGDAVRVHFGLLAALQDKEEGTLRLVLDTLFYHFPLHEENVFTNDQKVRLVAQVMLLLPSPMHAVLTRVFFWLYGGKSINWEYFESVSFSYVQDAFLWLFDRVIKGQGDLRCFEALFQLLQRSDEVEGAHFKRLLPKLIPCISKALCYCNRGGDIDGSPGVGLADDSRPMHLFEVVPWSHFLQFGQELLRNLKSEIDQGTSFIAESTTAVLCEVRSIIDSTSRHYVSLNQVVTTLPDLFSVLFETSHVLIALCAQRRSGVIEVPDFVKCMRLGIHLFNTLYLGVMRGYMTGSQGSSRGCAATATASRGNSPTESDPQAGGGPGFNTPGPGQHHNNSSGLVVVTTQKIYRLASRLVVAVVDTHITSSKTVCPTEAMFLSAEQGAGSTSTGANSHSIGGAVPRDDAALFAEVCQTLYTVLSHGCRDYEEDGEDGAVNFHEEDECDQEAEEEAEAEAKSGVVVPPLGLNRQVRSMEQVSGTTVEGEEDEEDEQPQQKRGGSPPNTSVMSKPPKSGKEGATAVPQWLQRLRRVVDECPPSLALAAAQLFFDAAIGVRTGGPGQFSKALLPQTCVDELHRAAAFRTVIDRLWLLLTASEAHQHMNIVQLLVRIYEHPDCAAVVDGVMKIADTSNCRRFATLFRVMHETAAGTRFFNNAPSMTTGLMMMLSTLNSTDTNLRLMSHAFLQHSVPYLHKVIEPMVAVLLMKGSTSGRGESQGQMGESNMLGQRQGFASSSSASPQPANGSFGTTTSNANNNGGHFSTLSPKDRLLLVVSTFCSIQKHIPQAFVKRLLALPPLANIGELLDFFHRDGMPEDDEVANSGSLFGSVVLLALRTVRVELHNLPFMDNFSSADYDVMLQKPHVPSFRQGDDTPLCVTSLELLVDIVSTAVSFDEPSESVTKVCSRISVACVTLLREAVCARLPATQVRLLQLLSLTMKHLDEQNYFTARLGGGRVGPGAHQGKGSKVGGSTRSEDTDSDGGGDLLGATMRTRGRKGGLNQYDNTSVIPPLRHEDFFATFSDGLLAGAVAELHPTMSCYGLLNQWTSTVTSLLPTFHAKLSVATSCYISVFVRILQNVKHRALAPPVAQVCKKSFSALTELFEFMYLPSTKDDEGGNKEPTGGTGAFSRLLGGGDRPDPNAVISNYDAAHRELLGGLHRLVEVAIEVFLKYRNEGHMIAKASSSGSPSSSSSAKTDLTSPTTAGGGFSQAQLLNQQMTGTPVPSMSIDTEECHQALRETVEGTLRAYLEPLLKNAMTEFFERIIVYLSKNSTPFIVLEAPEKLTNFGQVVDMLGFSAVLSPSAVVAAVETQLVAYRKHQSTSASQKSAQLHGGQGGASATAELPHDAACCLFLQMYMLRYRYKERNMSYLGTLLDALTNYFANAHSPLCAPLVIRTWDIMVRRFEAAQAYCDRRFMNVLCRLLENMTPSTYASSENHSPYVLAMRGSASCLRHVATIVLQRDPSDKLQVAAASLLNGAVKPSIQSMRQRGITDASLASMQTLYSLLLSSPLIVKKLKNEIVDFLFEPNFFKTSREGLNEWRKILAVATKNDRETNRGLMEKFKASTSDRFVSKIMSSDDDDAKAGLLKRLAFYLQSMEFVDREMLSATRERLIEIIKNYHNSPRQLALRQVFFVFRVIMVKVLCDFDPKNQQHLANFRMMQGFWPIIMPELIRVCSNSSNLINSNAHSGRALKSGAANSNLSVGQVGVLQEILKLIDFSITMLPSEFQTFRFALMDDTNSKEFSRTSTSFVPLLRSLHDFTPEVLQVNTIRSEFQLPDSENRQRPIFALPADRRNRLQGIDVAASALSATSVALEEALLFDAGAEEFETCGIIRKNDHFDIPYVQWLMSGEFSDIVVNPDGPPANNSGSLTNTKREAANGGNGGGTGNGSQGPTGLDSTAGDFLNFAFDSPTGPGPSHPSFTSQASPQSQGGNNNNNSSNDPAMALFAQGGGNTSMGATSATSAGGNAASPGPASSPPGSAANANTNDTANQSPQPQAGSAPKSGGSKDPMADLFS